MCECNEARDSDKFYDWQDYHGFHSWLNTNSNFTGVPVKKPLNDVGFIENWYKCNKCGTIWRLVEPDPPFEGVWEEV